MTLGVARGGVGDLVCTLARARVAEHRGSRGGPWSSGCRGRRRRWAHVSSG
uniref:Uncharacterized protein n=1 Tax=Arundo donax TaxID=35708 RepID=A0A0A8YRB9_ARUDO